MKRSRESEQEILREGLIKEKDIIIEGQRVEIEYLCQKLGKVLEKQSHFQDKFNSLENELLKKNELLAAADVSWKSKIKDNDLEGLGGGNPLYAVDSRRLELEIKSLKERINTLETKNVSLSNLNSTLRSRIKDRDAELVRLQTNPTPTTTIQPNNQTQDLLLLRSQLIDSNTHLKHLTTHCTSLEKRNAFLETMHETTARLKEVIRGLEKQVEGLDVVRGQNARLQSTLDATRALTREWTGWLEKEPGLGVSDPAGVVYALREARDEGVALKRLVEEMRAAERRGLEMMAGNLEKTRDLENRVTALKRDLEETRRTLYRNELELALMAKQKSLLRDSLDSFDQEQNQMDPVHFDRVRVDRIRDLEALLNDAYAKISQISGTSEAVLAEKSAAVQRLEERVEELEERLGEGIYNPLTTRILQLESNPALTHMHSKLGKLKALHAENIQLRQQASGGGGVPVESLRALEDDLEQMRKELQSRETSISRLKQVFQAKISGFRRFVAEGLGYSVDMQDGGDYKVSMRGFSFLVGEGEIVVSFVPKQSNIDLKAMMSEWIDGKKNMPGFFSALLQLLQK